MEVKDNNVRIPIGCALVKREDTELLAAVLWFLFCIAACLVIGFGCSGRVPLNIGD